MDTLNFRSISSVNKEVESQSFAMQTKDNGYVSFFVLQSFELPANRMFSLRMQHHMQGQQGNKADKGRLFSAMETMDLLASIRCVIKIESRTDTAL